MDASGEVADLMVKESIQLTEESVLASDGNGNSSSVP